MYASFSITSFALTLYSLVQKAVDYLTLVDELTDSFRLTLLLNFMVCCFLLFGLASTRGMFGELRIIEIEKVADQLPFFGLNLLFIMFNDENLLLNIIWAGMTIIAKVYHIIVLNRLDFIQLGVVNSIERGTMTPRRILRIFTLNYYVLMLVFFIGADVMMAKVLAYDIFQGVSSIGSLLFGIQFGVMGIEGFTYGGKLALNVYELIFYRSQSTDDDPELSDSEGYGEIVWESKSLYTQTFEIVASLVKAGFYSVFMYMLFVHSGLMPPIPITQGCFFAVVSVVKQVLQLRAYILLSRVLDKVLANATGEELEAADYLCIICREDMHSMEDYRSQGKNLPPRRCPKKLPCGHILHMGCLKDWLERSKNCPLCRKKVFGDAEPAVPVTETPPQEQRQNVQAEINPEILRVIDHVHQHAGLQEGTSSAGTPGVSVPEASSLHKSLHPYIGLSPLNSLRIPYTSTPFVPPDWTSFPIRGTESGEFLVEVAPGFVTKLKRHTREGRESQEQ